MGVCRYPFVLGNIAPVPGTAYRALMHFITKTYRNTTMLQLVEAYRNAQGCASHRVIVSLGQATISDTDQRIIAGAVKRALYGHLDLFDQHYTPSVQRWIDRILKRLERKISTDQHPELTETPTATETAPNTHRSQQQLFEQHLSNSPRVVDGVLLDKITHTHNTSLGPELVVKHAWDHLELTQFLHSLRFNRSQIQTATVSVLNRLLEPLCESALEDWVSNTSFPELFGVELQQSNKNRYYRVSDKLFKNKSAIESHIRKMQQKTFDLSRTILLYDLTNTHFEGICSKNAKAQYGKNKQKRNDCPQIVVGMVFDQDGFELTHQVFEGTQSDAKSLMLMIDTMKKCIDQQTLLNASEQPLVIMDAGIATKENLALLRSHKINYLVNDSRRKRSHYREQFNDESAFAVVKNRKDKSPVKICEILDPKTLASCNTSADKSTENKPGDTHADRLLLCKSDARERKEQAIVSNAEKRFLGELQKLSVRVEKRKLVDKNKILTAIGRIQAKHARVARFYQIACEPVSIDITEAAEAASNSSKKKPNKEQYKIVWTRNDEAIEAESDLFGCYVLRTNCPNFSSDEFWNMYMTLTKAEDGFRQLKSDLGLRPNHHHLEERVDAHVFIAVIAYSILRTIQCQLEKKGDYRRWKTIRRMLQTHCYSTIEISTTQGKHYRIRRPGKPELCQVDLYRKLGVNWKELPVYESVVGGDASA